VKPVAIIATLLLGALVTGLGHIALLPPFEGFDEPGHYSYIQQVADTGRWPVRGDNMSKEVDGYLKVAPTTENMLGPWTYHRFFSSGAATVDEGRRAIHGRAGHRYVPGAIGNWQAQHPPLYYFVMAPAYLASSGWSLAAQLFFLRSFSYLIAWAGLCLAVFAMLRKSMQDEPLAAPLSFGIALWPALFPMWFPEMARLGNDSLITVFAACTFLLVHRLASRNTLRDHALLGATLGLALLTKATYLPVAAAVFALLGLLAWFERRTPEELVRRLKGIGLCAITAVLIGGWWYVAKFVETGSFIGSNDDIVLKSVGGIVAGFQKNVDLLSVIRTPWGIVGSFLWAGTWSFILPPRITVLPIVIIGLMLVFGAWRYLKDRAMRPIDWLPILVLAFFVAALSQHSLVLLAISGNAAPAWYLHSLAPILALLVGYGIAGSADAAWSRRLMAVLIVYPPVFLLGATLLNLLFYTGCAPLIPGRRYFTWDSGVACLADYPRMLDNLDVLALPRIGIVLFVAGWTAMVTGTVMAARCVYAASAGAARRQRVEQRMSIDR
jgi:hypothetical protein